MRQEVDLDLFSKSTDNYGGNDCNYYSDYKIEINSTNERVQRFGS